MTTAHEINRNMMKKQLTQKTTYEILQMKKQLTQKTTYEILQLIAMWSENMRGHTWQTPTKLDTGALNNIYDAVRVLKNRNRKAPTQ